MKGKVILIGAGPGDPELLTIRAFRILQKADVVLTDRLVAPEILSRYVSPHAEIVYVGKQSSKAGSTPQARINDLMVIYAGEGKLVARLKGGDVSVFSNIADELETLVKNRIAYEIIPGITAASGAAAYSGIPLTARNLSAAVRFLTAWKPETLTPSQWKDLATTDDTMVLYMTTEKIDLVIGQLLQYGIDGEKRIAVVEQATTPFQKVHVCQIDQYEEELAGLTFLSPSLVIIGKVVALHEEFKWFRSDDMLKEFFKPIEESTIEALGLTA